MTKVELFAKLAFVQALEEACNLTVRPEMVSASSMSDEEVHCLVVYPGSVAEGMFRGDEDGGEIRLNGRSFWFEASSHGRAVPIEEAMTKPSLIKEQELDEAVA